MFLFLMVCSQMGMRARRTYNAKYRLINLTILTSITLSISPLKCKQQHKYQHSSILYTMPLLQLNFNSLSVSAQHLRDYFINGLSLPESSGENCAIFLFQLWIFASSSRDVYNAYAPNRDPQTVAKWGSRLRFQ